MADYIDRAALLEQFESFRADEKQRKKRTLHERWLRTIGIDIFAEAVKKFSSVDAVEVVRCKDCIYYKTGEYFKDMKFCFRLKHPKKNKQVGYNYPEDGFCSYGERRTDETD